MKTKDTAVLFIFVIIATIFSVFNVGYEPVHSDEVIYLSLTKYNQDPTLYQKDLLISKTLKDVPTPFYTLVGKLSEFLDKDLLFFFIYILTRALLIISIFFLAYTLFSDKIVAYLSVIILLLIRGFLVLASYDILDKIVFPFFLAVPLLLFSLAFFLRNKYFISSIILAVATYLHATTSFFILMLYGFYFILNYKKIDKKIILSLFAFLIIASPILYQSFSATSSSVINLEEWLNFIELRVSGHFFPFSWQVEVYMLFFLLIIMFLISFKHKPEESIHKKITIFSIGTLILFLIGLIFTELYPVKGVIQASLFRGIVIFRVIIFMYIINHIVKSVKSNSTKYTSYLMILFLLSASIIPFFVGAQKGVFSNISIEKESNEWEDVSLMAKELTSKDSLFITPTFSLGFAYLSERSEFINWKNSGVGVYSTSYVSEAIKRFELVCKHDFSFSSRTELVEECTDGYKNLNENDLKNAKDIYGVTHIITEKPKDLNLRKIYENKKYTIYEL
ncbi:hypothetical protein HYT57_05420 [Candidatus Woesearchaeota archaeon]|nr:hypothetical protein [Candidatus Woesearchaeota archaeon]